jgi:predicted deacylase
MMNEAVPIVDRIDVDHLRPGAQHRFNLSLDPTDPRRVPPMPVDVLVGRRPRPCLALVGGVHGDEYDGILALQELAHEVAPNDLPGSLLFVYVANPLAFAAAQRRTPEDDRDLNRVFPGRPDGSVSDRLAHRLCQDLLRQADLIFTLHGAMATGALAPWIEYLDVPDPVGRAGFAAARASGFPDLIGLDRLPGRLITAMADLGVPLIEGEVGGRGVTRPENVAYYKDRVRSVARHLGVLPPASPPRVGPEPRTWRLGSVEAPADGIFLREVELDQMVRAGDLLGRIVDARGDQLAEIRAPADAKIGGYREHVGARRGEGIFNLWLPN